MNASSHRSHVIYVLSCERLNIKLMETTISLQSCFPWNSAMRKYTGLHISRAK